MIVPKTLAPTTLRYSLLLMRLRSFSAVMLVSSLADYALPRRRLIPVKRTLQFVSSEAIAFDDGFKLFRHLRCPFHLSARSASIGYGNLPDKVRCADFGPSRCRAGAGRFDPKRS
jgi:hypothetical protein